MRILSIEPTPSPNVMKLNMDESLPAGIARNFTKEKQENAPEYIYKLLNIDGVVGVFQVSDFISLERHSKADWKDILSHVKRIFDDGSSQPDAEDKVTIPSASFGEVQVLVQMFKGIPTQVKLVSGADEMRFGMPERFGKAVIKVQSANQNYILERKWDDHGVRYGTMKEIGEEVVQELVATYEEQRLAQIIRAAIEHEDAQSPGLGEQKVTRKQLKQAFDDPAWEKRFAALQRIKPTAEDIPLLAKVLSDPKASIRRLAVVFLGLIGTLEVLPLLYTALKDSSVSVRRTAGDALSDIGDPAATPAMIEALYDPNKLVRWRAARFLFELGDETAIEALKEAQHDPEFEVSLQVNMALRRIESGEAASGTVWQQMTRGLSGNLGE